MRPSPIPPLLRSITSHTPKPRTTPSLTSIRSFNLPSLSSLSPSLPSPSPRTLTATRTLPYPPTSLFRTISAIEQYSIFLPFLTESTVTARDGRTGYPTQAYLTVGYGPLSETFLSKVDCDPGSWTVGARSGEVVFKRDDNAAAGGEHASSSAGLFEYLDTIWKLEPIQQQRHREEMTRVDLTVRFKFRSAMHAAMMSAVEGQVAGMMIEAFEKRVRDVQG